MHGIGALRRFAARPMAERCQLCAAEIATEHQHLVDPENHRLLCACRACAILFDDSGVTRYRRVPTEVRELAALEIGDAFWNSLAIPSGLVFFFRSSTPGGVVAFYPSPAGPTQANIDEEVWRELSELDRSIESLRPDVEALLVNRVRGVREYFIVPIDACYRLAGILRQTWQGFSGGDTAWLRVGEFFEDLRRRARPQGAVNHA
ncbi:MAG TPA: DUF5947 family protein [Bryobacteraceae bacterium]|nr:DUF5947 family protein [Bryobacteraceae bacterium]